MEFDKSKILTVVTADQAKVGQKGWFASNVETLSRLVLEEQPKELLGFDINNAVHAFKTAFQNHALFYPAPEPAYAERQAQWVKENNVKAGTKVRVTRTFTEDEDGSCCWEHDDLVGMTGVVYNIYSHNFGVDMSDGNIRAIPYFALEVIKEPTYRPFANAEEFKPFREKWIKSKQSNACSRVSDYSDFGVQIFNSSFKYRELMNNYEFEDTGDPCGIRNIV